MLERNPKGATNMMRKAGSAARWLPNELQQSQSSNTARRLIPLMEPWKQSSAPLTC